MLCWVNPALGGVGRGEEVVSFLDACLDDCRVATAFLCDEKRGEEDEEEELELCK